MPITVKEIADRKQKGGKVTCLTAYDYSFARILDEAGIDILLVGDSLGMVCLGYDSTVPVTMREMLHHTKAVSRGTKHALVVADMPFASYQQSDEKAVRNAARFLKEAGAGAVKIEGGDADAAAKVRALRKAGIPVMGHIGLTPQKASELGGYKVQGGDAATAARLREEAARLEAAGVFSIVLECMPLELAREITQSLRVPTIGIGAGPHCDGQVLVLYDLLGLEARIRPSFVRTYAPVGDLVRKAVASYRKDVLGGKFPSQRESFSSNGAGRKKTAAGGRVKAGHHGGK